MSFFGGMGNFPGILSGLSGLAGVAGLFGADAARRRANQQREQAAYDMLQAGRQHYNDYVGQNDRSLQQMAGLGGDAIRNMGARLGDSMAGAGVYNSSAVGGTLANAQRATDASIADLAARNQYNAGTLWNNIQQNYANARMGLGTQNWEQAIQDRNGAAGGLAGLLGQIGYTDSMQRAAQQNQQGRSAPPPDQQISQTGSPNLLGLQAGMYPNMPQLGTYNIMSPYQGMHSMLGQTNQLNLMRSGANGLRPLLGNTPGPGGGTENQGVSLPGNSQYPSVAENYFQNRLYKPSTSAYQLAGR